MPPAAPDEPMPKPEANGFVKTLNNMGFMTSGLDPYSREFVGFSRSAPGPSLDVGAAYGVASLAALAAGATIIANDVYPRHLEILRERAAPADRHRLRLLPGSFPDGLELPAGSLGAALVCRVLHFFDGAAIERAAAALSRWLAPGGKAFIVGETPFLGTAKAFFPTYAARVKAGDPWPGIVENVGAHDPGRAAALPSRMHLLDEAVLRRVFSLPGFVIERAGTFARPEFPADIQLDGRESVGLVARKR